METCRQYLTAHDWDVERAIETALISDSDLPIDTDDDNRLTTDRIPSAPPMPEPFIDEPAIPTSQRSVPNMPTTARYTPNFISYEL